jgi:hypothetical protein
MARHHSKRCFIVLVVMISMIVQGCNFIRITLNTPLTPEDVTFIIPGQTTLADVLARLGSPDSVTDSTTGIVTTYRFLDMKYSRVNFGWLARPWTPVDPDLIFSRTGFGTDALQVLYDSNGIVTQHSFLRHVTDLPFHAYPF